ncbi:hypothetical protein CP061683_0763B, partial [Chlamydia psittaci 06-1683]
DNIFYSCLIRFLRSDIVMKSVGHILIRELRQGLSSLYYKVMDLKRQDQKSN